MVAKRVLVVEDSPSQAARVVAALEEGGFHATHVTDGEQADALTQVERFDVVLSDVVMPGIDGYELCRRLKARDPDLPVVLLTSLQDPIEIVHGLEAGADNFLRKAQDSDQVVDRLTTMLHHRQLRGSGRATMGLDVVLRGQHFLISAERQQILDLLVSSFEDLVTSNRALEDRQRELQQVQEQLRAQLRATEAEERRLASVLSSTPQAIVITDLQGRITDVSQALCDLLGLAPDDMVDRPASEVIRYGEAEDGTPKLVVNEVVEVLRGGQAFEAGTDFDLYLHGGEGWVPVVVHATSVADDAGEPIALVGVLTEIDRLSAHDSLTHLPHQALFADLVNRALEATGADHHVAVLAVVVPGFSWLVGRLAPAEVEGLLASLGDRMRRILDDPELRTPNGAAGYFGQDAFGLVLDEVADELDAMARAERLSELIGAEPFPVGDQEVELQVVVGLALGRPDDDPVRLISTAVAAARRGAAEGTGPVATADPSVDALRDRWLEQQAELRAAITEHQLVVHYQPVMDLRSGQPVGVEALVRWDHPTRGLLAPGQFLPLAEESGLIVPLGWWVLEEACRQVAEWRRTVPAAAALRVSVNVDAAQVGNGELTRRVADVLDRTGLDPGALLLEITERTAFGDDERLPEELRRLKALGVSVAVDDFGTGYSSLLQLRRLPVDYLKVDRSFVSAMTHEREAATIVAATVRMSRGLGLDTVAEGVEVEEQLIQLRLLGCDLAQGYLWSPPLEADAFLAWLDGWQPEARGSSQDEAPPAEGSSATVEDVLSYLVHELRSPLTVIAGYARLATQVGGREVGELIEPILRSARDMEARLSALADVSDAAIGAVRVTPSEADLADLVATLVGDLAPQLAPHPVRCEADGSVPVRVDAHRISQAVTNLLVNAARYSPADAPIEVSVCATERRAEVRVRDHGPGIPPERRVELFRRFARLGRSGGGSGVGLHLVRAIARAHGGDAHFEPAPGGGACFVLALPLGTGAAAG